MGLTRVRVRPTYVQKWLTRLDFVHFISGLADFLGGIFARMSAEPRIAISMDGKGCWRDNVFIERLWKSVKYEEVYLRAYDSVSHAKASIGRYLSFYNQRRPHTALDRLTPDQVYFNQMLSLPKAA